MKPIFQKSVEPSLPLFSSAFRFLIALFFLMLAGCAEDGLEELKEDLGPQVPYETRDSALSKATGEQNPTLIRVDDWHVSETSARLLLGDFRTFSLLELLVVSKEWMNNQTIINLSLRETKYESDGSNTEDHYSNRLVIDDNPTNSDFSVGYQPCSVNPLKRVRLPEGAQVQVFKIESSTQVAPPPILVAKSPTCGGLNPCSMNYVNVKFDELLSFKGETQRFNCRFKISNQAPYLAKVLQNCVKYLVTIEDGRQIPAEKCTSVVNFRIGKAD
ncbi:MAG: hypothetical protein COT74_09470 [Bdellovibrionales bacterium CG10_big_fil_rev_8_21_14_0_10_45_34]|nr:MAG: hypothetical protein COT74_09470 [Bdellovibrionales bacterium CG10_big_fil_rev_8_21_14_0_10_45_34]